MRSRLASRSPTDLVPFPRRLSASNITPTNPMNPPPLISVVFISLMLALGQRRRRGLRAGARLVKRTLLRCHQSSARTRRPLASAGRSRPTLPPRNCPDDHSLGDSGEKVAMLLRMLMKEPRAGSAPLRRPEATCDTETRCRPLFSPTDASFTTLGAFKAPGAAVFPRIRGRRG